MGVRQVTVRASALLRRAHAALAPRIVITAGQERRARAAYRADDTFSADALIAMSGRLEHPGGAR